MAAFEQPRAGGQSYISDFEDASGKKSTTSMSGKAVKAKLQWVGSIAGGIAVGAAAAFLVAGFLGVHETVVGSVHVSGSSVIQSAP
jgi:uncharacterized protein (DUF2062 family)